MTCIPLAKPYTPSKLQFPVYVSTKYDGVPVRIDISYQPGLGWSHSIRSRQSEPVYSVQKLVAQFVHQYATEADILGLPRPVTFVGEVIQRGNWFAPFKDTSGIVRRQYDQSDLLEIKLFDAWYEDGERRVISFRERVDLITKVAHFKLHPWVTSADFHILHTQDQLDSWWTSYERAFPKSEGIVIRNSQDEWNPGKRSWGYQKGVREPTIDLRIVQFEEGAGKNANAVGRIWADYKGTTIGVGPGKLSYDERRELWTKHRDSFLGGPIATIKYKSDPSYAALRQPTFQHWRTDKTEPDA